MWAKLVAAILAYFLGQAESAFQIAQQEQKLDQAGEKADATGDTSDLERALSGE